MDTDIYEQLAKKLDELPEGFPATEKGVELKILREIFTPDEAEMALKMQPVPETAEEIAQRLEEPISKMRPLLDGMAKKGQIASSKMEGRQVYRLAPFVVGIYEYQRRERFTRKLVELFEEYLPVLTKKVGGHRPHLTRVIPINAVFKYCNTKTSARSLRKRNHSGCRIVSVAESRPSWGIAANTH
jgi:hypothetical protein